MDFKHVPSIIAIVKTFKNKPCRKTEIVFSSSNQTKLEIPSQSAWVLFLINLLYQKGNAFLLSKNLSSYPFGLYLSKLKCCKLILRWEVLLMSVECLPWKCFFAISNSKSLYRLFFWFSSSLLSIKKGQARLLSRVIMAGLLDILFGR